ncbi:MAG: PAS domain-containing protein [Anaerolineaceae bacterium]|nr:PAS domain-containing protein [Anaerolineaceae bacterium]
MDHPTTNKQLNSRVIQLETELDQAKLLLNAVIEQSPIPMVLVSMPDGIIQIVNPALMEFLGVQDELSYTGTLFVEIKPTWQDIDLEGNPVPQSEVPLMLAIQGKTTQSQVFGVIRKDGSRRWELVSAGPIYNQSGEIIAAFAAFPDITDLKQMEKALRESEESHRFLTDNAHDVIWMMDLTGHLSYVSPSVQVMRGYTADEVLNQSLDELLTPASAVVARTALQNSQAMVTLGQDVNFRRFELEQPCKDGSTIWTEVTASGVYGEDGKFAGFLGISRDISERKQIEKKLMDTMLELEEFNRAMVGREQRMIELKGEVNYLLEKLGKDPKYSIPVE